MEVHIKTIPHRNQRYETVGDWWWNGENLEVRISKMGNWKREMAVAYHELREALLCKHLGIEEDAVTQFDMEFEEKRGVDDLREPGDQPEAPYFLPHQYATRDERLLMADFGEDWEELN